MGEIQIYVTAFIVIGVAVDFDQFVDVILRPGEGYLGMSAPSSSALQAGWF
jgi:hypothetical protein